MDNIQRIFFTSPDKHAGKFFKCNCQEKWQTKWKRKRKFRKGKDTPKQSETDFIIYCSMKVTTLPIDKEEHFIRS